MDEALRSRLAMINAGIVEDANPDLTIHKIVLHNAAGDDDKLRTRPDVVGVIMKVRGDVGFDSGFHQCSFPFPSVSLWF
jgi:hypothetical protein